MSFENTVIPWLGRTMKMVEHHIQDVFCEQQIDLTKTQWVLLKKLSEKDGVAQQELAFLTGRDKTSLTRLVNTMEKKGLVARIPSKSDRRINQIHLTKKGELLYTKTVPVINNFAHSLQEGLSEIEINKTISVLKKVQENIKQKSTKGCIDN